MPAASSAQPLVRAVVVDDSSIVRDGLAFVQHRVHIIAAYSSVEAVLADLPVADLIILDLHLRALGDAPVLQGRAAVSALVAAGYSVCIYTDERRRLVLASCLRAGASGIIHKSDSSDDAADAFVRVALGETVITPALVGLGEILDRRGGLPELTARQRQVLSGRARGESWGDLCARLYITDATARAHMRAVNAKIAAYFEGTTPGDIERHLGLAPGDLFDD